MCGTVTDLGAPVKMYLFGMGGISPILFWAAVVLCWGLGEGVLALVRVMLSAPFPLVYGFSLQQTWYLGGYPGSCLLSRS